MTSSYILMQSFEYTAINSKRAGERPEFSPVLHRHVVSSSVCLALPVFTTLLEHQGVSLQTCSQKERSGAQSAV